MSNSIDTIQFLTFVIGVLLGNILYNIVSSWIKSFRAKRYLRRKAEKVLDKAVGNGQIKSYKITKLEMK